MALRRSLVLGPVLAALLAGTAQAQAPPVPPGTVAPPPGTAPAPPPPPKPGRASIALAGGQATRALRYVIRGQRVRVTGAVRPFVPGQLISVVAIRRGKVVSRRVVPVRDAGRGRGAFVARFVARRRGAMRVVARHAATIAQAAFRSRSKRLQVVVWSAGQGRRGMRVLLLQRGLLALGFAVPLSGSYDGGTARAVIAFRKTNGMARVGFASTAVYAKVFRGRGAFRLRFPRAGRHVEFDWSRQVLVLASGGRAWRVYHASSGKPSTPTVFGTFRFYLKTPGTNSHGMVDSNYFIGGYAIHGYPEVPVYPASHGCIRIPIPNAPAVYDWIPLGMRIFVYR